jgi:nucleoside-diphosphate-sugar epimerase
MNFTILGAGGTIGSALVVGLRAAGYQVRAIDRGALASFLTEPHRLATS